MGQTTVTQFAGELKMPASVLLEQLQKAGVDKTRETDLLSEQDKTRLLDFSASCPRRYGGKVEDHPDAQADQRDPCNRLHRACAHGAGRSSRKKRVFVKRDDAWCLNPPLRSPWPAAPCRRA